MVAEKDVIESHFQDGFANGDASYECSTTTNHPVAVVAEPASPSPANEHYVVSLDKHELREQLEGWWLSSPSGAGLSLSPDKIVGSVVRCRRGSSSPIVGYDPTSHRVITRSDHVYGLGMPETAFAAHARQVLRRMGF